MKWIAAAGLALIVSAALADVVARPPRGVIDLRSPDHPRRFAALRKDRTLCHDSVGNDAELFALCMRDRGWDVSGGSNGK